MNERLENARGHPIEEGVAAIREILNDVKDASFFGLTGLRFVETMEQILQAQFQVEELFVRAAGECEATGLGLAEVGAKSAYQLLTGRLRSSPDRATKTLKLARRLQRSTEAGDYGEVSRPGLNRIRSAFAEGAFGFEHAWRAAEAMAKLPSDLAHYERRRAEQTMVTHASKFNPPDTGRLGRHLLEVVNPEAAEEQLRQQLEREERRARRDRVLWFKDAGQGRVQVGGWLDATSAHTLQTALEPLIKQATRRAHSDQSGGAESKTKKESPRTWGQRRADALVELAEGAMRAGAVPERAGEPTQVVVTIQLRDLIEGVNAAYLPTGEAISATQARMMACDARVIPVVLDSAGVPLEVGQGKRTFDGKLRQALNARDGGCAFPSCTVSIAWTEGHHIRHWADGGATSLDNGVLLCKHHHRLVHHEGWTIRLGADRRPEFVPPKWIDPDQRPLRNPRATRHSSRSPYGRPTPQAA